MRKLFSEYILKDWNDIASLEVEWSTNVFRGQGSVDWPLSTSLNRALDKYPSGDDQPLNTEHWLLHQFKRRAHHYIEAPANPFPLDWLALMQHHGAPTRLLDFTYSFYIACFFALVDSVDDAAVWSFEEVWLRSIASKIASLNNIEPTGHLRDDTQEQVNRFANIYIDKILSDNKACPDKKIGIMPGLMPVEPYHQSKRMAIQQGLFIMPTDIELGILENIQQSITLLKRKEKIPRTQYDHFETRKNVFKIIIHKSIRETALAHLKRMNITHETLFPGIDGFSKSLIHTVIAT
jgi:hypothetical protein